jgi:hypothetical protein
VLDYVEFLESKYAERANTNANPFTRFTDAVEDKLRAGRVSASVIAETMGLLNKATNVLSGVAAAGKSVASDIVTGASDMVSAASIAPAPPTKPAAAPPSPTQPGPTSPSATPKKPDAPASPGSPA